MAVGDIEVIKGRGPVRVAKVDDRTTSGTSATLKAGEPLKKSGNFAILCATGDPEVGTDEFLGVAAAESTETSTADGQVSYLSIVPGLTELRGKATTPGNMDTDAELLGLLGDYVAFDLTAGVFTIDEDEGDDPNVHGLKIVAGDIVRGTLDVLVHALATEAAPLTGQTMD